MPRSLVRDDEGLKSGGRRRWRAKEARAVLKRLDGSGLAVREFAEREGLDVHRLYRWRARLGAKQGARATFIEISPPPTPPIVAAPAAPMMEVVLRSGDVVRVPPGFRDEDLRRLIAVLDAGRVSRC